MFQLFYITFVELLLQMSLAVVFGGGHLGGVCGAVRRSGVTLGSITIQVKELNLVLERNFFLHLTLPLNAPAKQN